MRCSNCGWENSADASRCEKCNAPLGHSGSTGNSYGRGYSSSAASGEESQVLKGTVPEGQIFGSGPAFGRSSIDGNVCSWCGYPLGRGMGACPRCGRTVSENQNPHSVPGGSSSSRPGTVNPWSRPQSLNECSLTPVPWEGDADACSPIKYSGSSIVLNRANTDPSNNTITSRVQAELVRENDGWYLTDKSELQTTYVHAGRKTKLEDGDIVILGNRRFVFKG